MNYRHRSIVAALLASVLSTPPEVRMVDRAIIDLPPPGDEHWKVQPKKKVKSWKRAKKKYSHKRVAP